MTQEEKAKAYDEALDRAKKELQTCGFTDCDAARQIFRFFPQLRESKDEMIRKALIDALKVSETIGELKFRLPYPTREECIAYLEKQKEQKPAEWSEEDEKHINIIFRILDRQQCWDGATGKKCNPYQDEIDWLKSLRPVSKESLQSHWKPSDEQMNHLSAAVDAAIRKHNESVSGYEPARVLKSLYEDLKKLM